jgi:hypothetical protein
MNRTLLAVSLALLAAPAVALEASAPYEQTQIDRQLPNLDGQASSGSTRAQAGIWADDHNFIAPAQ